MTSKGSGFYFLSFKLAAHFLSLSFSAAGSSPRRFYRSCNLKMIFSWFTVIICASKVFMLLMSDLCLISIICFVCVNIFFVVNGRIKVMGIRWEKMASLR